jgi:hypothetical protein
VTPCSSVVKYKLSGGTYSEGFLHDGCSSFLRSVCTYLRSYTIQKAVIFIFTMITSNIIILTALEIQTERSSLPKEPEGS